MNTAKIEQLKSDIATLKAAEEVNQRRFDREFRWYDRLERLERELKSLENAPCPAEVVRANELRRGDKVLHRNEFKIVSVVSRDIGITVHLRFEGGTGEVVSVNRLVVRLIDTPKEEKRPPVYCNYRIDGTICRDSFGYVTLWTEEEARRCEFKSSDGTLEVYVGEKK